MSALPSLPSTAPAAASLKGQAATVSSEPSSSDVSFAAVLSAQLGLSSAPQLQALLTGSEDAVTDDQSLPHVSTDATPVDPASLPVVVPFALPIVPALVSSSSDAQPDAAPQTGKPVAGNKTFLPVAGHELPAQSKLQEQPIDAVTANEEQSPATFAATLQTLPVGKPDTPQYDRAAPPVDVAASPTPAAAMPVEPRTESMHRAAPLSTAVSVPVQNTRWADSFSERVVWITGQNVQAAEIHIEPPQLGPIEVRVSITNDQANLMFTAPHAVAREAIQTSLPRLQEMLVDSGLTLGNVSVGAHTPGQQQPGYRDENNTGGSGGAVAAIDSASTQSVSRLPHKLGLVDLFA
jgi:flagellar hook-length control protein FliK